MNDVLGFPRLKHTHIYIHHPSSIGAYFADQYEVDISMSLERLGLWMSNHIELY